MSGGISRERLTEIEHGIYAYSQRPLTGLLKFTDYRAMAAALGRVMAFQERLALGSGVRRDVEWYAAELLEALEGTP